MMRNLRCLGILIGIALTTACTVGSANNPIPQPPPGPAPERPASGGPQQACNSVPLARVNETLAYCYSDTVGMDRRPSATVTVIYYFHGLGGDENEFFKGAAEPLLKLILDRFGSRPPIFVGLSIGSSGIFGDDTDAILHDGIPVLEKSIAPGKNVRRILIGASMGGHNSLRLAAQGGLGFTHAIAALCPALGTFNAWRPGEADAYRARHRDVLDDSFFNRALAIYMNKLTNAADWDANNPFTFLAQGAYDGIPIYMSVGSEDTLGLFEGTREFKARADRRPGMRLISNEVHGGHCSFNAALLLNFLVSEARD